jgi:purine-binding chemotaxis protein CheW
VPRTLKLYPKQAGAGRLLDPSSNGFDTSPTPTALETPLQKALGTAPERPTAVNIKPEREYFCFTLGGQRLGVSSEFVREVLRMTPLTPLPRAPAYVLGVCGHRGEVLPVIDLWRFLGKGDSRLMSRTRLFVATAENCVAGIVAENVIGLRRVVIADIMAPPLSGDPANEHVAGVVGNRPENMVTLLDFAKVMRIARQKAVGR